MKEKKVSEGKEKTSKEKANKEEKAEGMLKMLLQCFTSTNLLKSYSKIADVEMCLEMCCLS